MKSHRRFFAWSACLWMVWLPLLRAADAVQLETVLYVFKDASFSRINVGPETRAAEGKGQVFRSPVTLTFDDQILALNGATYAWNGDQPVPASFSQMAAPGIRALFGQSATVQCVLPVQYLEKTADGSLQVRQAGRDSPEVPHYQLTVTVQPGKANALVLSCALDVATLAGREKIPGVELEAGRPILGQFKEDFRFPVSPGDWSGITVRRPSGSDYSLLMLVKVSRVDAAAAISAAPPPKPVTPLPPGEDTLAASLTIAVPGVTDLALGADRRSRAARRVTSLNPGVRFGLKLQGPGPVYRDFEVRRHGPDAASVPHEGAVTIDPKQQWVVIDLREVVSKPGEPRRTEPCLANGRYPVEVVDTGATAYPPADQRGAGASPTELAVPAVPNAPYAQPK